MNIAKHEVMELGTYALLTYSLSDQELSVGTWHRSRDNMAGHNPYGAYLTNKNWHLNEVLYMLFQNCSYEHFSLN